MSRPEMRAALSAKHSKPIVQIDMDTGVIINTFPSGKKAECITGICRSHISHVIHGKRRHAGGYRWALIGAES